MLWRPFNFSICGTVLVRVKGRGGDDVVGRWWGTHREPGRCAHTAYLALSRTTSGVFRRRLGYFVEGLMIGSEELIRSQLEYLRASGRYLRRRNPIRHLDGLHLSLREQRSHAVSF